MWLDIFQKIKALGYNGVSFYTNWALLEGKPGNFTAEGVFAFDPFFDAAKEAGIYLLAVSAGKCTRSYSANTFSVRALISMPKYLVEASRDGCSVYQHTLGREILLT